MSLWIGREIGRRRILIGKKERRRIIISHEEKSQRDDARDNEGGGDAACATAALMHCRKGSLGNIISWISSNERVDRFRVFVVVCLKCHHLTRYHKNRVRAWWNKGGAKMGEISDTFSVKRIWWLQDGYRRQCLARVIEIMEEDMGWPKKCVYNNYNDGDVSRTWLNFGMILMPKLAKSLILQINNSAATTPTVPQQGGKTR